MAILGCNILKYCERYPTLYLLGNLILKYTIKKCENNIKNSWNKEKNNQSINV